MSCILIFLTLLIQCLLFCFEGKVFQSGESKITKSGTFIILYIIHSKKTEFTFETNKQPCMLHTILNLYSVFFSFFLVEIVISNVEEGPEVQNQLLGNATVTQEVFYESNESSEQ